MAALFSDEGLVFLANVMPRSALPGSPLWLGLFTGGSKDTVPPRNTVLAGNPPAVGEPTGNNYERVLMPSGVWGAPALVNGGVRVTASRQSFLESRGPWGEPDAEGEYPPVNGFFIATTGVIGEGIGLYYANFADGKPVPVNTAGYLIRVEPFLQYANPAA